MKTHSTPKSNLKGSNAVAAQAPDGLLNIAMGKAAQYSPFADGGLCSRLNRSSKPVTVLVAEHRTIVRQGIRAALALEEGISIIGEASDGCQAAELAEKLHPDAVVISASMASVSHMSATRRILHGLPAPRVIILAPAGDDAFAQYAARLGAAGYLTEEISSKMLARTLRDACKGAYAFGPGISRPLPARPQSCWSRSAPGKPLTARQKQVLQLIAEGSSNKQTASTLSISIKTVEKHREQLMSRLGIHETAGLTRYAISSGMINNGPTAQA